MQNWNIYQKDIGISGVLFCLDKDIKKVQKG